MKQYYNTEYKNNKNFHSLLFLLMISYSYSAMFFIKFFHDIKEEFTKNFLILICLSYSNNLQCLLFNNEIDNMYNKKLN